MAEEVRGQAQGAGAARSLGGAGALASQQRRILAEYQLQQQIAERGIAVAAGVALGGLAGQQTLLGVLDRLHDRRAALGVLVHADAEVELGRAGIGAVGVHQAENRVAGYPGNRLEMTHGSSSAVASGVAMSCGCRTSWIPQRPAVRSPPCGRRPQLPRRARHVFVTKNRKPPAASDLEALPWPVFVTYS
ncbi:hypothetical protein D9M71_550190 [compost metagenome]